MHRILSGTRVPAMFLASALLLISGILEGDSFQFLNQAQAAPHGGGLGGLRGPAPGAANPKTSPANTPTVQKAGSKKPGKTPAASAAAPTTGTTKAGAAGKTKTATPVVEKLVDADPQKDFRKSDKLGMNWDPDIRGQLNDGTSDCFDNAMTLSVNANAGWSQAGKAKKTEPGGELVLAGVQHPLNIQRRIRINLEKGVCRYIDTFHNTSRKRIDLSISYRSMLGASCNTTLSNLARPVSTGPLAKDETGIVAFRNRQGRPSVIWHLCGAGTSARPNVSVESQRTYVFHFNMRIAPGKKSSVCITLGQRHLDSQPDGAQLAELFKPLDAAAAHAMTLTKQLGPMTNLESGAALGGNLSVEVGTLPELVALLEERGITRSGTLDSLLLEDGQELAGEIKAADIDITAPWGKVHVPADNIAAIVGGGGIGQFERVLLRNGEILGGKIEATKDLALKTDAGLVVPIKLETASLILFRSKPSDGARLKEDEIFVRLLDGSNCIAALKKDARVRGVAPWGDIDMPSSQVAHLGFRVDPYPSYWVVDIKGSRFPVALQEGPAPITSPRFAGDSITLAGIAAIRRGDVTLPKPGEWKKPHITLVGGAQIAGTLEIDMVRIRNGKRITEVALSSIHKIVKDKKATSSGAAVEITTLKGEASKGILESQLIKVKSDHGTWSIPAEHLVSAFIQELPPKEDAAKDDLKKDGDPNAKKDEKKVGDAKKSAAAGGKGAKPAAAGGSTPAPPPALPPIAPVVPTVVPGSP